MDAGYMSIGPFTEFSIARAAVAQLAARPVPAFAPVSASPARPARFSALEWQVVALAARDRPSSLRRPGALSVALGALFGGHNPRLADTRLEALRRIAVLSWRRGYSVSSHEVRAFIAAGDTPEQYETLLDSIFAAQRAGT